MFHNEDIPESCAFPYRKQHVPVVWISPMADGPLTVPAFPLDITGCIDQKWPLVNTTICVSPSLRRRPSLHCNYVTTSENRERGRIAMTMYVEVTHVILDECRHSTFLVFLQVLQRHLHITQCLCAFYKLTTFIIGL